MSLRMHPPYVTIVSGGLELADYWYSPRIDNRGVSSFSMTLRYGNVHMLDRIGDLRPDHEVPGLDVRPHMFGEQRWDQDAFSAKIDGWWDRVAGVKDAELYYYFQPVEEIDGAWIVTGGRRKLMFATYSYLGLIHHPRIVAASRAAVEQYGTGTHGVRILGGTLDLHTRIEARIAEFMEREDAIVFSSGYVTNLATISALVGRGDWVLSDRWNHASIVDGCRLAQGIFKRFKHNDMRDLERILRQAPATAGKLVVADAVFSMDGDIFNLPRRG